MTLFNNKRVSFDKTRMSVLSYSYLLLLVQLTSDIDYQLKSFNKNQKKVFLQSIVNKNKKKGGPNCI